MSVYVDDMEAPLGRMTMCHMIADTRDELLEMADMIGLDPRWIQDAGTDHEHFDISKAKRRLAVEMFDAEEITMRELAEILHGRDMEEYGDDE